MNSKHSSAWIVPARRLALCAAPLLIASLVGCGGGGGGGGSSGGGTGSSSSSSSSATPTAYVGGGEFLVNTGVDNDQNAPTATTLANGNVVIGWVSSLGTIGGIALSEIRAQIVTPDGIKSGGEIVASTGTLTSSNSHRHIQPTLATLGTSGFGLVYTSNGHLTTTPPNAVTSGPLFAREFSATGAPLSDAIVPPLTFVTGSGAGFGNNAEAQPQATALSDGRLLLSWTDSNVNAATGGDGSSLSVKAQLYSADADELAPAFTVNTETTGQQSGSRVGALSNGGFVVTWQDYNGSVGSSIVIKTKAQIYTSTGQKVGGEIVVNTAAGKLQSPASITALAGGQFVVAWSEGVSGGTDDEAYAQIFDATGTRVGGLITLATNTSGRQVAPVLTTLPNGHFIAAWGDNSGTLGDTDGFAIKAQAFTAAGVKFGNELLVNTYVTGNQTNMILAPLKTNGFVVTWVDTSATLGDASGTSIKARVFKLN